MSLALVNKMAPIALVANLTTRWRHHLVTKFVRNSSYRSNAWVRCASGNVFFLKEPVKFSAAVMPICLPNPVITSTPLSLFYIHFYFFISTINFSFSLSLFFNLTFPFSFPISLFIYIWGFVTFTFLLSLSQSVPSAFPIQWHLTFTFNFFIFNSTLTFSLALLISNIPFYLPYNFCNFHFFAFTFTFRLFLLYQMFYIVCWWYKTRSKKHLKKKYFTSRGTSEPHDN